MPQREIEFFGSVPWEEFRKRHLYAPIIEAEGKLYLPHYIVKFFPYFFKNY